MAIEDTKRLYSAYMLKPSVGPFFVGTETTPPLHWYAIPPATDSEQEDPAMPLPVPTYFERRLRDLHTLSPATAKLAERIAVDLKPEVLSTSSATLEAQLLDHLQEVAQQHAHSVTRLWGWLNAVVSAGALRPKQAAAIACEAATLGGPSGVVPE